MFGPDGFGGIHGDAGTITAAAGQTVGIIARWSIRRSGSNPDGKPRLRFRAHFSWKQDALMSMISRGQLKGRVRVQMKTVKGLENIDIVQWDEWKLDEDGALTLENILHFDTQPLDRTIFTAK